MPLFEVAILEHPTKKELEEGAGDKLVYGPKAVIAKDNHAAGVAALLGDDKPAVSDLNLIEVLVRPFLSTEGALNYDPIQSVSYSGNSLSDLVGILLGDYR